MPDAKFILWLDYEGNGKKPQVPLEVGGLLTGVDFPWPILERFEFVIAPPDDPSWREDMPEVVVKMHTDNGLFADIDAGLGLPVEDVEQAIIDILKKYGSKHDFIIGGSGVAHYDRPKVVEVSMPKLDKWLQYPAVDVGSTRRLIRFAGRPDLQRAGISLVEGATDKPHRGLADIIDHHAESVAYGEMIRSIVVPQGDSPSITSVNDTAWLVDLLQKMSKSETVSPAFKVIAITAAGEISKLQAAYQSLGGGVIPRSEGDDTERLKTMLRELSVAGI